MDNFITKILIELTPFYIFCGGIYGIKFIANIPEILNKKMTNKKQQMILEKKLPNCTTKTIKYAKFDKETLEIINEKLKTITVPEELKEIFETFKQKVDKENLITCIKNIENVKIKKQTLQEDFNEIIKNIISNQPYAGHYLKFDNKIELLSIRKRVLSHEFLHMASATTPYNTGFNVLTIYKTYYGRGLNEGYTELLNKRIFNHNYVSYKHNVQITELFETFFDNPKDMETAYFNSNLDNIYITFNKYGTKKEFTEIMKNLDDLATTNIPVNNNILSLKTKMEMYKIIKRSKNPSKINKFENILDKDPLIKLLRHSKITLIKNEVKDKNKKR